MLRTASFVLCATAAVAQVPEPRLDLEVLYAGVAGSPRAEDWRQFLASHVGAVEVIDTKDLTRQKAAAFHVVVLDCPDPIVRDAGGKPLRIATPAAPGVGVDFGKPIVVVGGMAMVPDHLHLKLGWL